MKDEESVVSTADSSPNISLMQRNQSLLERTFVKPGKGWPEEMNSC
jgi:hypothetical protein